MEFGDPPAKKSKAPQRKAENETAPPVLEQQESPDPAFADVPPEIGNRIDRAIARGLDYARKHVEDASSKTVLDQTILSMRKRGLSVTEIEHRLEGQLTREQIESSLAKQLSQFSALSQSEMRALQIARIEDVINMCYDYARGGSDKHVGMLLLAIERLNKVFELETEKTKIEINLVTSQQAGMLVALVDTLLRVLLSDPRIKGALEIAQIPIEYIDGITADALDAAEAELARAQETILQLDLKNETATKVEVGAAN